MSPYHKYTQLPGHIIAASIGLPVLDTAVVFLRFWIRKRKRQGLKIDDWLMIPALLLLWGIAVAVLYGVSQKAIAYPVKVPVGFHGSPLALATDQISLVYQIQWAYSVMLPLALGCIKTSFISFYLRIFAVTKATATYMILVGMIIIVALASIAFFLAKLFECRLSFWAIWGSTVDLKNLCIRVFDVALWLCITDFGTDIVIICIPIPLIWRLNLSLRKKLAILGVFLIGSVTVVASLLRLIAMANSARHGFDPNEDGNLVVTESIYWATIECGVGVLAACLPSLNILIMDVSWKSVAGSARSLLKKQPSGPSHSRTQDGSPYPQYSLYHSDNKQSNNSVALDPAVLKIIAAANGEAYELRDFSVV